MAASVEGPHPGPSCPGLGQLLRRGIDNVIRDVRTTRQIAGTGMVFVLVDRDKIAEHLGLAKRAPEAAVVREFKARSDAADKFHPYFLKPNLEGLLRSVRACDETLLPAAIEQALGKSLNRRDIVLNEVKRAPRATLRECIRARQPGLDALAKAIAALIPKEAIT